MFDAGKLDRRIALQEKTASKDALGGLTESWVTIANVWAQYLTGGGSERFSSAQIYAETQARFRIRWMASITPEHRIVYDGKEWDILSVDEIGRKEGIEIKAKARA